jgi:hypothetical protein
VPTRGLPKQDDQCNTLTETQALLTLAIVRPFVTLGTTLPCAADFCPAFATPCDAPSHSRQPRQISRFQFDRLPCTTAGFTTSALDGYGLRRHLPLRPPPQASYPALVHRLASLLHASFGPRLAASVISPLRFAMTSPPSGCQRDFHPQAVERAQQTEIQGQAQPCLCLPQLAQSSPVSP